MTASCKGHSTRDTLWALGAPLGVCLLADDMQELVTRLVGWTVSPRVLFPNSMDDMVDYSPF